MLNWARDYFEVGYAQRWSLHGPSDQVRQDAAGLWDVMGLSPGARLIDIGCGHGKYAVALAERGASVIGLDFAASLLDRAKALTVDLQNPARWIRGDMRRLPLQSGCADGAVIVDAFGFFETDDDNDEVLREAARVLRVGGRIVLKVVNGGQVLDDFRSSEREEREGVVVVVTNALEVNPPRLIQRLQISGVRGTGEYERRQRLYRADDICAALERIGLSGASVFASPDRSPFDHKASPAMWVVGQRV